MTNMLLNVLGDAVNFPLQVTLMKESMYDEGLARNLSARFGVELEVFKDQVRKALEMRELNQNVLKFTYDQINAPRGPIKSVDQPRIQSKPGMIKIQTMTRCERNNPIQQAVFDRKYELIL
jgi:hypothetical protein